MADFTQTGSVESNAPADQRLRVFISYSHEDREMVKVVARVINENGMTAVFDKNGLRLGKEFPEQIIHCISHAHIFLPLLTQSSVSRAWAQQEIGYALALRVPTVPVAINCEPGQFLHGIQAIHLNTSEDMGLEETLNVVYRELKDVLTFDALEPCLHQSPAGGALYECADTTEERAILFKRYASAVSLTGNYAMVRQLGGLSSFHIPIENVNHSDWYDRYGGHSKPLFLRNRLHDERLALTEHARRKGCKIVINPDLDFSHYGGDARRSRLGCLLRFLLDKTIQPCLVAIDTKLPPNESITMVGDWFAAHSISNMKGDGYRHTIFTRHAPSIGNLIEEFDRNFEQALGSVPAAESRDYAIAEIQSRIDAIAAPPDTEARGTGRRVTDHIAPG
jgi:hypothetical protein